MEEIYRFFFDLGDHDLFPDFSQSIEALKRKSGSIFWRATDMFSKKDIEKYLDEILSKLLDAQNWADNRRKHFMCVVEAMYKYPHLKAEIEEGLEGFQPLPQELAELFYREDLEPEEFDALYEANLDLFGSFRISSDL